jgi:hypothetical protein
MDFRCDTCGRAAFEVKRVLIRKEYDRSRSNPLYNCQKCFEKKIREQKTDQK